MKVFTLLLITLLIAVQSIAQTPNPVFNWKQQEISPNNNLKKMTLSEDGSANIIGFSRTFKKSTDQGATWQDIKIVDASFDFKDMSFAGNVGYVVSARSIIIDNPTNGETDVKANGIIIKTSDKGQSWSALSLKSFGEGTETSTNPSAPGCYDLDFTAVQCVNDTIVYAALRWNDQSSGLVVDHSALLKSVDGGGKWKAVTADFEGDVINDIKYSGDFVYFGGNGMLWKISVSDDELSDLYPAIVAVNTDNSMFVYDLFIYNDQEIYATTSADGVFKTTDGGTTFAKLGTLTGGNAFFKLNDNVMICLGTSARSKSTVDGGNTWIANYPGASCWAIGAVLNDSLVCLAKQNIYRIATSDLSSGKAVWKSQMPSNNESFYGLQVFDENNALLIGAGENVLSTTNKGISWTQNKLPELLTVDGMYDFNSISKGEGAEYAISRKLKFADYTEAGKEDNYYSGLVIQTTDNWASRKILNNKNIGKDTPEDPSKCPTMTGCFSLDPYVVECVNNLTAYLYVDWYDTISTTSRMTHSRVFRTTDGGDLWTAVSDNFAGSFVTGIAFSGDTGFIAGNNILLKTVDGGQNFTDLYPVISQGTDGNIYFQNITLVNSNEIYLPTAADGVFYSKDSGVTFTKFAVLSGANDLVILDKNSFMALGASTKSKFTNDGGETWTDSYPGSTVWAAGEILNDSLYVLCKSVAYKIAVADLDIKTSVKNLAFTNDLKVLYGSSELQLVSSEKTINRCFVYTVQGKLVSVTEPNSLTCKFCYSSFAPGIYIISADVEGKKFTQKVLLK